MTCPTPTQNVVNTCADLFDLLTPHSEANLMLVETGQHGLAIANWRLSWSTHISANCLCEFSFNAFTNCSASVVP